MLHQVFALLALGVAALVPGAAAVGCDTRPTLRLYSGYDSRGQGDLKPDVKALQSKLGIPDDGFFGPNTESKVMDYQDEQGLTQDGIVGPNTWAALCGDAEPSDPSGEANCGSLENPHGGAPRESPGECTHAGTTDGCWSPAGLFVRDKVEACFPDKFYMSTYISSRPPDESTHPANAIDAFPGTAGVCYMSGPKKAQGDALRSWVMENADALNVKYVVWQDKIWSPERASEGMRDQNTPDTRADYCTKAHFDHVHISVN